MANKKEKICEKAIRTISIVTIGLKCTSESAMTLIKTSIASLSEARRSRARSMAKSSVAGT